jgi:hypothetical protein
MCMSAIPIQPLLIPVVTILNDSRRGFGLEIGFTDHLQVVTTNNYNTIANLHTPNITVTTAHIKSFQSSLIFSWQRILTQ